MSPKLQTPSEMTNNDLDAWIAEHIFKMEVVGPPVVMGGEWRSVKAVYTGSFAECEGYKLPRGVPLPPFTEDPTTCRQAEGVVADMGVPPCEHFGSSPDTALSLYLEELCHVLDIHPEELSYRSHKGWYSPSAAFTLITATPRQRCEAMYGALKEYL